MNVGSIFPAGGARAAGASGPAVLVAAVFWSFAFVINEGVSYLRHALPFETAGGHRAAAFGFGALLALASSSTLRLIGPQPRKQAAFAAVTILLMPALHATVFFLTCKVAPIDGVAPMTLGESIEKGLLSTGYFSAWIALQLALIYHGEARARPPAARGMEMDPSPDATEGRPRYWASWGNQRVCVRPGEIRWIEAQKDYAILHCATRSCIIRMTLTSLAAELSGDGFVRIHRSAIVRSALIASIYRRPTGALVLTTSCGAQLPLGRSYVEALRGNWLPNETG